MIGKGSDFGDGTRSGTRVLGTGSAAGRDSTGKGLSGCGGTRTASGTDGTIIGSALTGSQTWGIPAGFDVDGFLQAAKKNFISLQSAWDKSDIETLRAMMTDTSEA